MKWGRSKKLVRVPIKNALELVWPNFCQNGIEGFDTGRNGDKPLFEAEGYHFKGSILGPDTLFTVHFDDHWHSPEPWLEEATEWFDTVLRASTALVPRPKVTLQLHWTRYGATGNMGIHGHVAIGKSDSGYASHSTMKEHKSWLKSREADSVRGLESNRGSLEWHIDVRCSHR